MMRPSKNMRAILVLIGLSFISPLAKAHLMVAQQGTLNVVDGSVYMVLSLPISAFAGIDQDQDGRVTMIEMNRHRKRIVEAVNSHISLADGEGVVTLSGLTLSPVLAHAQEADSLEQLIVMGRFELRDPKSRLHFTVGLFGEDAAEQELRITATRRADQRQQVLILSPQHRQGRFF